MSFHEEIPENVRPCSFCNVYLPFRFDKNPIARWNDALKLIPNDETVFSVDRVVAEYGVNQLIDKFHKRDIKIKKIQCFCNYGQYFQLNMIQLPEDLTALNLCGVLLNENDVMCMMRFKKLEELFIRVESTIPCMILRKVYNQNEHLKHLSIIGHEPKFVCMCLKYIPRPIQHFSITNCTFPQDFINSIVYWHNLERLRIESCRLVHFDFIETILRVKPNLIMFQFNFNNEEILPEPIHYSGKLPCNITHLTLINNVQINDDKIKLICTMCPKLECFLLGHLNFSEPCLNNFGELPDMTLTTSLHDLPMLSRLRCLAILALPATFDIKEYLYKLQFCKNLETLYLSSRGLDITDIVCHVIYHCLKLTSVYLMGYNFTIENLKAVVNTLKSMEPADDTHELIRGPIYIAVPKGTIHQQAYMENSHYLLNIYNGCTEGLLKMIQNLYM